MRRRHGTRATRTDTKPAWDLPTSALKGRTNAIVTIRMVVAIGGWKAAGWPATAAESRARAGPSLDSHHGQDRARTQRDAFAEPDRTVEDRIEELRRRRKAALHPGGRDAAQKQHE